MDQLQKGEVLLRLILQFGCLEYGSFLTEWSDHSRKNLRLVSRQILAFRSRWMIKLLALPGEVQLLFSLMETLGIGGCFFRSYSRCGEITQHILQHLTPEMISRLKLRSMIFENTSYQSDQEWQQMLDGLPSTVTSLTLFSQQLRSFNHEVQTRLPPHLTHLQISFLFPNPDPTFNPLVACLPPAVTHLTLHTGFNHPIARFLPEGLTHLTLSDQFNCSLDISSLPGSPPAFLLIHLTHLTLGREFNQPFFSPLPSNLKVLIFGEKFNQPLEGLLPRHLKKLDLGSSYRHPLQSWPPLLFYLKLSVFFNFPLVGLPDTLRVLILGSKFNQRMERWPSQLRSLHLGSMFQQSLAELPSTLQCFSFDRSTWPLPELPFLPLLSQVKLPVQAGRHPTHFQVNGILIVLG